jgi:hypothetical protein
MMADLNAYDQDKDYQEIYGRFLRMVVPPCAQCGSPDTASVQVGLCGITIRLAATCRKFKLIPNGPKPGNWFCNLCQQFFDIHVKANQGVAP